MKTIVFTLIFSFLVRVLFGQQSNSFKTSDGEFLYYSKLGHGPRVLLLYGGPGYEVSFMKAWADTLSNSFECVLFDQRGNGLSGSAKLDSTTINIKRAAEDIEDLRKHLGDKQLTICGISWGGVLSQIYAAFYPQNVKKIVLVSTMGPDASLLRSFNDNVTMRTYPNELDSLKFWNKQPDNQTKKIQSSTFSLLAYFYDHKIGMNVLPNYLSLGRKNQKVSDLMWRDLRNHYDIKSELKCYNGECVIIHPRQDVVPEECVFQIKNILPQAKIFTIEKCGHFPDLEKPTEFFKLLRRVL